ncbi:hypothetical protein ACJJIQ_12545 [Microbulbifer sp. ANSA003]|uniref:hypothetical protein n=1 Tax=Microbulbifer sp. ANSA003 TaxID=3243360 RepID=UPI004041575A
MKTITTLIVGFFLGVGSTTTFLSFRDSGTSEVWTLTKSLQTNEGMIIPSGTHLTVHKYMPEGYVSLDLNVNVEGVILKNFHNKTINKNHFRSPVWAEEAVNN